VALVLLLLLTVPTETPEIVSVLRGDPAPFQGLLVPEERFVELLEAENAVRELQARLAASERTLELVENAYMQRLENASSPVPWYASPTFNRWLGFGMGIAATGLAVWGGLELVQVAK
jgi:hypothetical protein